MGIGRTAVRIELLCSVPSSSELGIPLDPGFRPRLNVRRGRLSRAGM